jgi:hypothetical protein
MCEAAEGRGLLHVMSKLLAPGGPSAISLSAAKDLHLAEEQVQILRYAQDDNGKGALRGLPRPRF